MVSIELDVLATSKLSSLKKLRKESKIERRADSHIRHCKKCRDSYLSLLDYIQENFNDENYKKFRYSVENYVQETKRIKLMSMH